MLEFLTRSSLRTESRMEWFLPVNGADRAEPRRTQRASGG